MSYIGLLEYNWENPTRTKQWVLPMLVPGSAEFLNMRQSQIDEHPAVAKFFEQASKGALARATPMVPPGGAGIGMHVIPVEQAIQMEDRSVSIEHIEHWLDKYEGKYAASPCSCRMSRAKLGEGCGDDPNDWCIAVGDMADYVVAGGTDALCRFTLNGFNSLSILDRERCRPFDATRAGLNLGEGAGYLVLTHERPGMRTYCRLTGYANANDAYHQTASSQTGEGAYRAMAGALAQSGLRCVDYINVHGTATPNNDLTEGTALRRLFGGQVPPFSSTKGYTGHALAAAGGIEAVLAVLAITHGLRYGNPGFAEPIPELGLRPVARTQEADVRSVLSNSFGFGGNCCSLIFAK